MKHFIASFTLIFIFLGQGWALDQDKDGTINIGASGLKDFKNKLKEIQNRTPGFDVKPIKTQVINENCSNCPPHLSLVDKVNTVLAKLAETNQIQGTELPSEITKLKMLYYVSYTKSDTGKVNCQTFDNGNFLFDKQSKMEGSTQLIAEEFFSNTHIENLLLSNPQKERQVYYFRSDEADNILIKITAQKGTKPTISYYEYFPTEKEKNPYNLPDLGSDHNSQKKKIQNISETGQTTHSEEEKTSIGSSINFDGKLIKKGKLPRDYQVMSANLNEQITEDLGIQIDQSLLLAKGNLINVGLIHQGDAMVRLNIRTKLNGETEHEITVPVSLDIDSDLNLSTRGELMESSSKRGMSLAFLKTDSEIIRTSVQVDKATNKHSLVFSKDFMVDSKSKISVDVGRDSEKENFVSIRQLREINKGTHMLLEVKYDDKQKGSIYYSINSRF